MKTETGNTFGGTVLKGQLLEGLRLNGRISAGGVESVPSYEGSFRVMPKTEAQTLKTAGKKMEENVFVEAIPVKREANAAGGETVVIG